MIQYSDATVVVVPLPIVFSAITSLNARRIVSIGILFRPPNDSNSAKHRSDEQVRWPCDVQDELATGNEAKQTLVTFYGLHTYATFLIGPSYEILSVCMFRHESISLLISIRRRSSFVSS